MTSGLTSALEVSHIMRYTNRRILYFDLLYFTLQAAATNHDDNSKDGHWATKQTIGYYWEPIWSRIWEIDWCQNEWPWPSFRGRIKVMSTIAWHRRWISRKPL